MDERQYPFYGYAPGSYMGRCKSCGHSMRGVDKRAYSCLPCAEKKHEGNTAELYDAVVKERDYRVDTLQERLRGQYRMGPHLPNREPEFGWRQFEAPPIQHFTADIIDELIGIIQTFVDEQVEYMNVNKLGDPEKQHTIICARKSISKIKGM